MNLVDMVEHQVIAAIRSEDMLQAATESKADIIFLLTGNIFNLEPMVARITNSGKKAFIHVDFTDGITSDKTGIQYIARNVRPAGIISTKGYLIASAKEAGLFAVQRLFLIDSSALKTGIRSIHASGADAVEVMPGIMPQIIEELTTLTPLPIIAGGLVRKESEVHAALKAGALAVSVGEKSLWDMDL